MTSTPTLGWAWLPYLCGGIALLALAMMALRRAQTRATATVSQFLFRRGAALVLLAALLAMLADAAAEGDGLTAVDRPIWSWLVNHRTGLLTSTAEVITTIGSTVAMGVLAGVVFLVLALRPHRRGDAALVAVVTAGAGLLVTIAKPIVGRVRPPEEFRLVVETNQSFPSGHAVASMAVIGVLIAVFAPMVRSRGRRIAAVTVAVVFVAAIGLSRLYLGVHWPTDILGGWLSGFAWLLLCLTVRHAWRTYPIVLRIRSREFYRHLPSTAGAGTAVTGTGRNQPKDLT